ncbi:hypothetical protein KFE25_000360 [Diacronema lutheri]|uniref:Transmembrane protein 186 n=1 Tax=Diacronema lutheri TaxID=2081491 RepID=A0A8J5XV26_DIALT|nr:hypothetical protein KFE25_000360 [Diacronema lutheri]|mmetsp:Transcript_4613/g.14229  ORF Transcript_4613/g.14229 Transcript_4613/m.14229 type:complete len:163 (-) Transcript_4613:62-550(-)
MAAGALIYRSPWVLGARLLLRAKVLQVGTMVGVGAPLAIAMRAGELGLGEYAVLGSTFAGSVVVGASLAFISERFVGEIRLHKEAGSVVVSTLSVWGQRLDHVYPVAAVVPLAPRTVQQRRAVPLVFHTDAKGRQHVVILRDDHAVDRPALEQLLTGKAVMR